MNCKVCGQELETITQYPNMPAMAQHLHDTPDECTEDLNLCQCSGCGLVQLGNMPVWYWQEQIRIANKEMDARIEYLKESGVDFVSCNYLEHVPDPNSYLSQFTGRGVIEVPNFNMIYSKGLFAELMIDHLFYFTEDTLRFTLQYNGFDVISIEPIWDYYILSAKVIRRKLIKADTLNRNMAGLKMAIDRYIAQYNSVAIYGASHQAFAYIATLKPDVAFIVDDADFKQGKYAPVGGLMIHRPEHLANADAVIIMGAGYSDIIAKKLKFNGGVAIMRDWGLDVLK